MLPALFNKMNKGFRRSLVLLPALILATRCRKAGELSAFEAGAVAPHGSWVYLVARDAPGFEPRGLFLDVASGRRIPVPSAPDLVSLAFAGDGSRAAWIGDGPRLVTLDLSGSVSAPHDVRLEASHPSEVALSPDGRRAAILDETRLLIADAATGRTIHSSPIPGRQVPRAILFIAPERLRLYPVQRFEGTTESAPRTDTILEVDVSDAASGALRETGRVGSDFPGLYLRPSASGQRLISLERRRTRVTLRDGGTGEAIAPLPTGAPEVTELFSPNPPGKLRAAAFLSGGRIAAILHAEHGSVLRVYSPAGAVIWSTPFEESNERAAILGEAAPGVLLVALGQKPAVRDLHVLALDLETGRVRNRTSGLSPLDVMAFWHAPATGPLPELNARLFLDERGSLVSLDPATFGRTTIAGTR